MVRQENKVEHEQALIKKAQEGDENAFRGIFNAYKERAVRMAYSVTGNLVDAQDIAQDALIRIYKNINTFKEECKFSTWFYRIVVNLCRDFLRKKGRNRIMLNPQEDIEKGGFEFPDKKNPSPQKALINKELGMKIDLAVAGLPQMQQIVFILKYKQQMKISEVSSVLGIAESTVKVHLFRAVGALKKKLIKIKR